MLALYLPVTLSRRMNMKLGYLLAMMSLCPLLAHAEIYKAVDADGHVTYSSTPIKGGKKITLEPLPTMVPPARAHSALRPRAFREWMEQHKRPR